MHIRAAVAVLLAVFLQPVFANADSVTRSAGSKNFEFAIPEGQCVLEDSNRADASFSKVIATLLKGAQNTLIVASAECSRRAALRRGEAQSITDYAAYYTPDQFINTTVPGKTETLRKQLCADMRKQGDATLAGVEDIVAEKAKELRADIAVTSTKYVGVMAEDAHGCYAALLIGVKGADGGALLMTSVVTSTVSHGKPLFLAIYRPYEGPRTIKAAVADAKATMAEFDTLNGDSHLAPMDAR
jgi:hypothetical protein